MGTALIMYKPVEDSESGIEVDAPDVTVRYNCITLMKEYENKSLEELRTEDYAAGRVVCLTCKRIQNKHEPNIFIWCKEPGPLTWAPIPFRPTVGLSDSIQFSGEQLQSITCMLEYKNKSFEELRMDDFALYRVKCPSCKKIYRKKGFGTSGPIFPPKKTTATLNKKTWIFTKDTLNFQVNNKKPSENLIWNSTSSTLPGWSGFKCTDCKGSINTAVSSPKAGVESNIHNDSTLLLDSTQHSSSFPGNLSETVSKSILEGTSESQSPLSTERMKNCLIDFVEKYHLAVEDDIKKKVNSEVNFKLEKFKNEFTSIMQIELNKLKEEITALKTSMNVLPNRRKCAKNNSFQFSEPIYTENLSSDFDMETTKENISFNKSIQSGNSLSNLDSKKNELACSTNLDSEKNELACSTYFEEDVCDKEVCTATDELSTKHFQLTNIQKSSGDNCADTKIINDVKIIAQEVENKKIKTLSERQTLSIVSTESHEDDINVVGFLNEENSSVEYNSDTAKSENGVIKQLLPINPNEDKINDTDFVANLSDTEHSLSRANSTVDNQEEDATSDISDSEISAYVMITNTNKTEDETFTLKSENIKNSSHENSKNSSRKSSKNSSYETLLNAEDFGDTCVEKLSDFGKIESVVETFNNSTRRDKGKSALSPNTVKKQLSKKSAEAVESTETSDDTSIFSFKGSTTSVLEKTPLTIDPLRENSRNETSNTFGSATGFSDKPSAVFRNFLSTTKTDAATNTFGPGTSYSKMPPAVFERYSLAGAGGSTATKGANTEATTNIFGSATDFSDKPSAVFRNFPSTSKIYPPITNIVGSATNISETSSSRFGPFPSASFGDSTLATTTKSESDSNIFGLRSSGAGSSTVLQTATVEPAPDFFGFSTGFPKDTTKVSGPSSTSNGGPWIFEPTPVSYGFDTADKPQSDTAEKVNIHETSSTVHPNNNGVLFLNRLRIMLDRKFELFYEKVHADLKEVKRSINPDKGFTTKS